MNVSIIWCFVDVFFSWPLNVFEAGFLSFSFFQGFFKRFCLFSGGQPQAEEGDCRQRHHESHHWPRRLQHQRHSGVLRGTHWGAFTYSIVLSTIINRRYFSKKNFWLNFLWLKRFFNKFRNIFTRFSFPENHYMAIIQGILYIVSPVILLTRVYYFHMRCF